MSKVLGNSSIISSDSFRVLNGSTFSGDNTTLVYNTNYNKSISITTTKEVIIRSVDILTQIGDYKHYDLNNKFRIIATTTQSIFYGAYSGWQESWSATASGEYYQIYNYFDGTNVPGYYTSSYFTHSTYTFSEMLSSSPIPQTLKLDMFLPKGEFILYIDELYNTNIGYIMSTTVSNFPFTDSQGALTVNGTSSFNQKGLSASTGNFLFNWVVSDIEDFTLEKGGLVIQNNLQLIDPPVTISKNSENDVIFSIEKKNYNSKFINNRYSYTASLVLKNIDFVPKLKIGNPTNYIGQYNYPNRAVYMADSTGLGSWVTYSGVANGIIRTFDFWTTGSTGNGSFTGRTIPPEVDIDMYPNLPNYVYFVGLNTTITNEFSYRIIDNITKSEALMPGITVSVISAGNFYSNTTPGEYCLVIQGANLSTSIGLTVSYPGWKIIIM